VPLNASQKAALALRIVVARDLHDQLLPVGERGETFLLAARARLKGLIGETRLRVKNEAGIGGHLSVAAATLRQVVAEPGSEPDSEAAINAIARAAQALETMAAGVRPGDGDGPALAEDPAHRPCACGFLDLANLVEKRAQSTYIHARALSGAAPAVHYVTWITDDPQQLLGAYRVGGSADIGRSPRTVTLTIKDDDDFGAVDLCQLAYVLHHELFCHAFQAPDPGSEVKNAPPQCHWTEGWMDRLAFKVSIDWVNQSNAPHTWLPIIGADAEDAIAEFHKFRYHNPRGLRDGDKKFRRAARQAFDTLAYEFRESGLASSDSDGENLARCFSLVANAHPNANSKTLRRICALLQTALLGGALTERRLAAALACFDFLHHRDLAVLEKDLGADPGRSVPVDPRISPLDVLG